MVTDWSRTEEQRSDFGSRLGLHSRHDMAVQVERYADVRVAEKFLNDLRVNVRRESKGCETVAQAVEPSDARKLTLVGNVVEPVEQPLGT